MLQTKLIQYLQTLSDKEMGLLGLFIQSQYHNRRQRCVQLFEVLKKQHPRFEGADIDKERVFAGVFGKNQTYKDQMMRNLCSQLLELTEQFLATEHMLRQPVLSDTFLLAELNQRHANRLFEYKLKQARQKAGQLPYKNEHYHRHKFGIELEAFSYYGRMYPDDVPAMAKHTNLNLGIEALSEYYLYYLLNHYMFYLNARNIYEHPFAEEPKWRNTINALMQMTPQPSPLIKAYYLLVQMLALGEDQFYTELKQLMLENSTQLPLNDVRNCYINLENYCMKAAREGKDQFLTELLHIYQTELELNMHVNPDGNTVSVVWLVNAVLISLRTGNTNWAQNVLEQHYQQLPPNMQTHIYSFCMANICFYQARYNDALQHLSTAYPNYYYSKMDIKCLLLRIFYEKQEYEVLFAQIDAFRHYLSNNEDNFPPERIANVSNFVKYTARLARLKETRQTDATLSAEIAQCPQITYRNWLLSKAAEITG